MIYVLPLVVMFCVIVGGSYAWATSFHWATNTKQQHASMQYGFGLAFSAIAVFIVLLFTL